MVPGGEYQNTGYQAPTPGGGQRPCALLYHMNFLWYFGILVLGIWSAAHLTHPTLQTHAPPVRGLLCPGCDTTGARTGGRP